MLFCLFETDRCNTRRNTTLTTNSPTLRRFQPLVTPSLAYPEDGIDLNRSKSRSFSFRRRSSLWTTFHLLRRGRWYTTRSRTDSNSTVQEEEEDSKERVVVEDDDDEEEEEDNIVEDTRSNQTANEEEDSEDSAAAVESNNTRHDSRDDDARIHPPPARNNRVVRRVVVVLGKPLLRLPSSSLSSFSFLSLTSSLRLLVGFHLHLVQPNTLLLLSCLRV